MNRMIFLATVTAFSCSSKHDDIRPGGTASQPIPPKAVTATIDAAQLQGCTAPRNVKIIQSPSPFAGAECRPPCPSNSPVVNSFPVNGIDARGTGTCNPEGLQIVPGSVSGGKCPANSTLGFDDKTTQLVASDGSSTCSGDSLKGVTFTVRSYNGKEEHFSISDTKPIGDNKTLGYLVTRVGATASLCSFAESNAVRSNLGVGIEPNYDLGSGYGSGSGTGEGTNDDYVIAVPDPLYSDNVLEIENSHRFFNLACVGDALAKRTLEDIAQASDSDATKLAALRMLTATYCGRQRTARKMNFRYLENEDHKQPPAEARWMSDSITCLHSPRLKQLGENYDPSNLPSVLIPADCKGNKCKNWGQWTSAVRKECKEDGYRSPPDGDCKSGSFLYESFLPKEPDKVLYLKGDGSGGEATTKSAHEAKR